MIVIPYLIIGTIFALIGAGMARRRNRDAAIWGLVCFLFPLLGVIVLAIAGNAVAATPTVPADAAVNMKQWETLVELDPEIGNAAGRAKAAGPLAERLFAEKYLAVNDKKYLEIALSKALEQASSMSPAGKVGKVRYRLTSDGRFIATSGRNVGRVYASLSELESGGS